MKLWRWIDCIFFIIILYFVFISFTEIKIYKKILCLESKLISNFSHIAEDSMDLKNNNINKNKKYIFFSKSKNYCHTSVIITVTNAQTFNFLHLFRILRILAYKYFQICNCFQISFSTHESGVIYIGIKCLL